MTPRVVPGSAKSRKPVRRWSNLHIKEADRHHRWFFSRWESNVGENEIGTLSMEGYVLRKGLGFGVGFDMEDEWSAKAHLGLGRLLQVWVGASRWPSVRWLATKILPIHGNGYTFRDAREFRLGSDDGLIYWNFWYGDPHESRSDDPKHRKGLFNYRRWLTGRNAMTNVVRDEGMVPIHMPEGSYMAKYTLHERTDTWPRFKRKQQSLTGEIAVEGGVYVPGSGESSYNCGPDAVFSLYTQASSVAELVGKFVESVYKTRLKYNGNINVPVRG